MKDFISSSKGINQNILTLNDNQLKQINWIEEDELIYNGTLYDLITISKTNNDLNKLVVIADGKEEHILFELCNYSLKNLPINKVTIHLFKLLNSLNNNYFPVIKFEKIIVPIKIAEQNNNLVCLFYCDIIVPPPKQV